MDYGVVDVHLHHLTKITAETIRRATSHGVAAIMISGVSHESNVESLRICRLYEGFAYPTLGAHPFFLEKKGVENAINFIRERIGECVALGEIGLDYGKVPEHLPEMPRMSERVQRDVFERLLRLSIECQKPVILHMGCYPGLGYDAATKEALDLIESLSVENAVFHRYLGSTELLAEIIERGYYISASLASFRRGDREHEEAVKFAPLDKILLETDSAQPEYEPLDILKTLKKVAELKGIDEKAVAEVTTTNARKLFQIGP